MAVSIPEHAGNIFVLVAALVSICTGAMCAPVSRAGLCANAAGIGLTLESHVTTPHALVLMEDSKDTLFDSSDHSLGLQMFAIG